jgi:hypothetical protein
MILAPSLDILFLCLLILQITPQRGNVYAPSLFSALWNLCTPRKRLNIQYGSADLGAMDVRTIPDGSSEHLWPAGNWVLVQLI